MAISDVMGEVELDPETMDTIGLYEWKDELSPENGRMLMNTCAHPSKIADDPALYNYMTILDVGLSGPQFSYTVQVPSLATLYR